MSDADTERCWTVASVTSTNWLVATFIATISDEWFVGKWSFHQDYNYLEWLRNETLQIRRLYTINEYTAGYAS